MTSLSIDPTYRCEFTVPSEALDQNGHVNNVQFVQWMQEAAVRHFESVGGVAHTLAIGSTWVVRSHTIEYFRPAFAEDTIEVQTWVANIRRVRSLRRYRFLRKVDGKTSGGCHRLGAGGHPQRISPGDSEGGGRVFAVAAG